jgi:hypothetical protein
MMARGREQVLCKERSVTHDARKTEKKSSGGGGVAAPASAAALKR